jgi:type IV secretory pathway TraG/TraD family ATPase VirD4
MGTILRYHNSDTRMIAAGQKALAVHTQSPNMPVRSRRVSPLREGPRVQKRGLYLGTTLNGKPLYLAPRHLRLHLHVLGPTGTGKSRLMLWIYQLLCHTNRPIVLIDPKGGLYRMARDWALVNGFQKRLVLFDLSGDVLPGYNPLRPTNLRIDLQTQYAREGVKSAWGSSSFDSTPLLARMLYLCLYTARALAVSMMEALDVLRPSPALRHAAIQKIGDPFVKASLIAFDNLSDRIKAEQASSTISRLEMFLCNQTVREVICSPQSLDLEHLLAERKIILVNFGKYQPLLPDAVKLLGRMFFNDLLAHIYKGHGEGRFDENHPCFVLCDEVQNFATKQVCDSLDEGRGIGCHMTIAHQHLSQLADEDQSGYLYHSVLTDARTKVIFPGLSPQDL